MIDRNDPRLTAYVLGELDAPDIAEVEAAIEASSELRDEVAEIRKSVTLLGEGLQAEPCPTLSDAQRQAIDESVADDDVTLSTLKRTPSSATRRWSILAVAATLLLVALGIPAANYFSRLAPVALTGGPQSTATVREEDESLRTAPHALAPMVVDSPEGEPAPVSGREVRQRLHRELGSEAQSGASGNWWLSGEDKALPAQSTAPSDPFGGGADESGVGGDLFGGGGANMPPQEVWRDGDADAAGEAPEKRFGMGGLGGGGMGGSGLGGAMGGAMGGGAMRGGERSSPPVNAGGLPGDRRDGFGGALPRSNRDTVVDFYDSNSAVRSDPQPIPATPAIRIGDEESQVIRLRSSSRDGARAERVVEELMEAPEPAEGEPREESRPAAQPAPTDFSAARLRGVQAGTPAKPASAPDVDNLSAVTLPESEEAARGTEPARMAKKRTWRRAAATPNASRLVIGDRDELPPEGMQVNIVVDGFRARVLVDMYYFNNRAQQLEGNFKLRLPNDSSLYYFAFGQSAFEYRPAVDELAAKGFLNGELLRAASLNPEGILSAREGSWSNVKEAKIVPREKAAHAYGEVVRRRVDPALVEWSGAGVFNARVFPLMPNKLHRIVIGYDVTLQQLDDDLVYRFEVPEGLPECRVDLNVAALPGTAADVTPEARPFTASGRAYYHFENPDDREIELRLGGSGAVVLQGKDEQAGDFFAARVTPDLPDAEQQASSSHAIFLLDTSLSSRPDKFNVWLKMLETTLTENRDSMKQFAVQLFNIETHWWKDGYVENTTENVNELLAFCHSLSLEGATDLRQAFREATSPEWKEALGGGMPSPDIFLLSDGAATWGELNPHRLSSALQDGWGGTLFAYQTGMTGTATSMLAHLTRETGGAVFSIATEDEVAKAATAHRSRPWKLLDVTAPGGTDLLIAGRPQFIYPGQSLLVSGRGEPDAEVTLHVKRGEREERLTITTARVVTTQLAPRVYGEVAVGQLEDLGSNLEDVAVAYARHFRVTGRTCSLLMLESEADYARFNIKPEDDAFVVRSSPSADLITQKLDELAEQLGDAKASFTAWLEKMESVPGFDFKVPTALKLVIERLPREAFEVDAPRLDGKQHTMTGVPKEFLTLLEQEKLGYDQVTAEAARRFQQHGAADALKTLSSLIENNPGDPVLARDVAFSAIEWGLGGQAYPLLQRVVRLRPYEPPTYQAMAQCLAELGHADLAMIYYEVALNGRWNARYKRVNDIVGVEYLHLLRRINSGELTSKATDYATARLDSLQSQLPVDRADLVITMMWNTDRTDVDLHIIEPTNEECYYEHPRTKIGGQITPDVTEGFGPEMYWLPNAKHGKYRILANYFGTDANRTQARTKVYMTIYENFGRKRERITKKTTLLSHRKEKRELTTVMIEK